MGNTNYEIIVSDDNSPDGTAKIAEELSKEYNVKVLIRKSNKGLSPAVCDGFKIAKGDIIGVIDADLSHPPEIIPNMIRYMQDTTSDIVVASRLIHGGGIEKWPIKRKITSYIATTLARPLTKVKDPMSGFFFLNKKVIDGVKLETKGYKILLEILVKGKYKKAVEYPFIFKDRAVGESKLNIKTNIQYIKQLFDLYIFSIGNMPRHIKHK